MRRENCVLRAAFCIALGCAIVPLTAQAQSPAFRRGDVNSDGQVDAADPVRLLGFLFMGEAVPSCLEAADANDSGSVDLSDAVLVLKYLLSGGAPPRPPFPVCGADTTPDALGCRSYGSSASAGCDRQAEPEESPIYFLTNVERAKAGLAPLKRSEQLEAAMQGHVDDMAHGNYFSHLSLDGRDLVDRITATGYQGLLFGENIAAGYLTPADVMAAWLGSPGHRANLLGAKYRELGVGHTFLASSKYGHYWGQDFGARKDVYPVIMNLEAATTASRNVDLYIYGSGWAKDMQVSNDAKFTNAAWQAFVTSMKWTLPAGAGKKTVYVKLRNGTVVVTSSDSIQLIQ